jgi:hypothetical protein
MPILIWRVTADLRYQLQRRESHGVGTIGAVVEAHINKVTAVSNVDTGIALGGFGANDNHLNNNVANNNGIVGIRLYFFAGFGDVVGSDNNHINGNQTNNNGSYGIKVDAGSDHNHMNGNGAFMNGVFDLSDGAPNCDANNWNGNHFNTADQGCIS